MHIRVYLSRPITDHDTDHCCSAGESCIRRIGVAFATAKPEIRPSNATFIEKDEVERSSQWSTDSSRTLIASCFCLVMVRRPLVV